MSGVRSFSFREGDRSEYLAQFLLSALGLCTAIPRQEDIGFDFSCSIADQEDGILTFGYPYLISIKSASKPYIIIEPTKTSIKRGKREHLEWLFLQEQSMFLGVVDKDAISLCIYSLLPVWFLFFNDGKEIGSVSLLPRSNADDLQDVGKPVQGSELKQWPGHYHYDVDLGYPIAIIDLPTIKDEGWLRKAKEQLRLAVEYGQKNLVHNRLLIPHFYWLAKTTPDASSFHPAFFYLPVPPNDVARKTIMSELTPSLISFALHFQEKGDSESLGACLRLLRYARPEAIPPPVRDRLPKIEPML